MCTYAAKNRESGKDRRLFRTSAASDPCKCIQSDCEQLFEKLSLEYLRKFRDGLNENNDSGSFYMDYQVKDLSIKRWGRASVYAVDNDEFNSAEHVMILFQDITERKRKRN